MFIQIVDKNDILISDTDNFLEVEELFNPEEHKLYIDSDEVDFGGEFNLLKEIVNSGNLEPVMAALYYNDELNTLQQGLDYYKNKFIGIFDNDRDFVETMILKEGPISPSLVVDWSETVYLYMRNYYEANNYYFHK